MSCEDQALYIEKAQAIMKRWQCRSAGQYFFTHSSLLWPVYTSQGEQAMLKIVNPQDDEAFGAKILQFFEGQSVVRVLKDQDSIQLLEWIDSTPTQSLERMVLSGDDDKATQIICSTIQILHKVSTLKKIPSYAISFRQRSLEMLSYLQEEGRVQLRYHKLIQIAFNLAEQLIEQTKDTNILLHGDIHHLNVLFSKQRGWLAIDPKGIAGSPIYEYANLLCNPYQHQEIVAKPQRMKRQATLISEFAKIDEIMLMQFTFVHAMQCAAWSLSTPDQNYWCACAFTAAKILNLPIA